MNEFQTQSYTVKVRDEVIKEQLFRDLPRLDAEEGARQMEQYRRDMALRARLEER